MGEAVNLGDRLEVYERNETNLQLDQASVYQLVYFSTSLLPPLDSGGQHEIENMLAVAQSRNNEVFVTGALTYNELHFAQVLEGNRADVGDIFRSIMRDSRHSKIRVAQEGWVMKRDFPTWAMAYVGEPGSLRVISPNVRLRDLVAEGNLAAIGLIEMMKLFLLSPSPTC